jgi:hypothetical protein
MTVPNENVEVVRLKHLSKMLWCKND